MATQRSQDCLPVAIEGPLATGRLTYPLLTYHSTQRKLISKCESTGNVENLKQGGCEYTCTSGPCIRFQALNTLSAHVTAPDCRLCLKIPLPARKGPFSLGRGQTTRKKNWATPHLSEHKPGLGLGVRLLPSFPPPKSQKPIPNHWFL